MSERVTKKHTHTHKGTKELSGEPERTRVEKQIQMGVARDFTPAGAGAFSGSTIIMWAYKRTRPSSLVE